MSAQLSVEKHVGSQVREIRRSAIQSLDEASVKEKSVKEEQTVYAQAFHYTTRMVSVLISRNFKPDKTLTDHHSDMISNSISNSVADTDSLDA